MVSRFGKNPFQNHFDVSLTERLEYIWTGGQVNRGRLNWPVGGVNVQNWSHTGG